MPQLLKNSGFEGNSRLWNGISEVNVAEGWYPFWLAHRPTDEEWQNRQPVYRVVTVSEIPRRVRAGQKAQMYSTAWATHVAGLMQVVQVSPGQRLRLRAYGHARSTSEDAPNKSIDPGNVRMKVGLDPTGGTDPFNPQIHWSAEKAVYDSYDDGFLVEATATGTAITAFLLSMPQWPRKYNEVYWDDTSLEFLEGATAGVSASPSDGAAMLVLESQTAQINYPVSVYATSSHLLANVHLSVSGPDGSLEARSLGAGSGGRGHLWQWEFIPKTEGPYTVTFGADAIEAVTATIRTQPLRSGEKSAGGTQPTLRGKPRTQYSRTYVLLPPAAGKEWAQAVLESDAWLRHRWTLGFSADDAGIGDLEARMVLVINPTAWPDPILPWFELWYPGIQVRTIAASTPAELSAALRTLTSSV